MLAVWAAMMLNLALKMLADQTKSFFIKFWVKLARATTLNIPDTVGINVPFEFGQLIAGIKANTPGIKNAIISTHCQNDLGLSTANTVAGACVGARQVEVSMALVKELETLRWKR